MFGSGKCDGIKFTSRITFAALDTKCLIDQVRLFAAAADAVDRAFFGANRAPGTFFGINTIGDEIFADFGRTFLFGDVRRVFVSEIF